MRTAHVKTLIASALLSCAMTAPLRAEINPGDVFIIVANSGVGTGEVYKITGGGDFSTAAPYASGLYEPHGLAFDAQGRLFVVERAGGRLIDITQGGDFSTATPFAWNLKGARSLLIDSMHRILVAERDLDLVRNATDGGDMSQAPVFASGLSDPRDLLQLQDGRIFLLEEASGEVTDITRGGDFSAAEPYASGFNTPYAIAQSADGKLYINEIFSGNIFDFTQGGSSFTVVASGLQTCDEIAFTAQGQLLAVQELKGTVVDVSAGGNVSTLQPWASGLMTYPQRIAVAPLILARGDTDNDGILDRQDNCRYVYNPDQANSDNDRTGDVCDTDWDDDGLTNDTEATLGTDPNHPDSDRDGENDGMDLEPLNNFMPNASGMILSLDPEFRSSIIKANSGDQIYVNAWSESTYGSEMQAVNITVRNGSQIYTQINLICDNTQARCAGEYSTAGWPQGSYQVQGVATAPSIANVRLKARMTLN